MSGLTTQVLMVWGMIIVSSLAVISFMILMVIAFMSGDHDSQKLFVGAVIAQFTTVVSFWLGSSIGSQRKDDAILPQISGNKP